MSDEMKRKIEDAARDARLAKNALTTAEKKLEESGLEMRKATEAHRKADIANGDAFRLRDKAHADYSRAVERFHQVSAELLLSW